MKLLPVILLLAFLLLFSGCIQQQEAPIVIEKAATEQWKADGIVSDGEYSRSMVLQSPSRQGYSGGEMEISWKNDNENIYLALNGSTNGWLAIGFDPLEWMKNSDMILGLAEGGNATVLDEYCTGNYGPHIEDTMLGGSSDIAEYGGSHTPGRTVIELKRKLDTGDRFDKALKPGQAVSIIWALSSDPDMSLKHNVAYGEGILTLTGTGAALATTALSAPASREKEGLIFIWEEEKTARDLYSSLNRKNNLTIFQNLIGSEQSHMDQAGAIMDRYGLTAAEKEQGAFQNQTLQGIYDRLLREGLLSDQNALKAAAAFEEISIMDLEDALAAAEKEDIKAVYQGLLAGSRKHLRSYVSSLKGQGIDYSPRYINDSEFQDTIKAVQ